MVSEMLPNPYLGFPRSARMNPGRTVRLALVFLVFSATVARAGSFRPVYEKGAGKLVPDPIKTSGRNDFDLLLQPTALCVDATGNLWVLEPQLPAITKFTPEGAHVITIQSRGEGPGDLAWPILMDLAPRGGPVVYDISNRRFSFFGEDGHFIRAVGMQESVWGFGLGPSGECYLETHDPDLQGTRGGTEVRLWRYTPDLGNGSVIDSALVKDNEYIHQPRFQNVPIPFPETMVWAVTPRGHLVVARTKDYSIKILGSDLTVLAETRHEGTHLPVTEEDREDFFANMQTSTGGVVTQGAPEYIRKETHFPAYKPSFRSIQVDHEGYLLFSTYETTPEGRVFDVFDSQARFVNRVTLPDEFSSCVLANGYAYRLDVKDEAATVRRYRLE
jgi:hypothetical protein